ncbi:hypothetical protein PHAVU_003G282400 [Phaseolus vulgaris]|uniref:Knottins-like domain-containing protein n=1 Tax=Phaseolus vulgaris TaxID=3885 RepID=V7CE29_PHAVU|nr:hypothetical protein PHAVU_003G282400g [Phaseolus vulgaris]ESW28384.1 hypothetical protein PHAVU_003G282400g [Phaseolus vulgaris]
MARSVSFVSTIFVFLLLLLATEMGPRMVAEARGCESRSRHLRGKCESDENCASACRTERFSGGHCRGFRCRCFCDKRS